MLDSATNSSLLGYSPPVPSPPSLPLPPPHFVDSFNPVSAGIHLLLTEWFDKLLSLAPPTQQSVSVSITATSSHLHSFPVLLESAFTLTPTLTTAPLILDTGASCCLSRCKEDFVSYSPSTAKIHDLSGINTVAGEGILR